MTEHRKIPGYLHHSVLRGALEYHSVVRSTLLRLCDTLAADERRASERASDTPKYAVETQRLHHYAEHLQRAVDGFAIVLRQANAIGTPIGHEALQALTQAVGNLTWHAAEYDVKARMGGSR